MKNLKVKKPFAYKIVRLRQDQSKIPGSMDCRRTLLIKFPHPIELPRDACFFRIVSAGYRTCQLAYFISFVAGRMPFSRLPHNRRRNRCMVFHIVPACRMSATLQCSWQDFAPTSATVPGAPEGIPCGLRIKMQKMSTFQ